MLLHSINEEDNKDDSDQRAQETKQKSSAVVFLDIWLRFHDRLKTEAMAD